MDKFKIGDKVIIQFEGDRHDSTDYYCGWEMCMEDDKGLIGEVTYVSTREDETETCYNVKTYASDWMWHESALKKAAKWRVKKAERSGRV